MRPPSARFYAPIVEMLPRIKISSTSALFRGLSRRSPRARRRVISLSPSFAVSRTAPPARQGYVERPGHQPQGAGESRERAKRRHPSIDRGRGEAAAVQAGAVSECEGVGRSVPSGQ